MASHDISAKKTKTGKWFHDERSRVIKIMWGKYGKILDPLKLPDAKLKLLAFHLTRFAKMIPEKGFFPEIETQIFEALRKGDAATFHMIYKNYSEKNERWKKWKDELEQRMFEALRSQDFSKFSAVFDHLNPIEIWTFSAWENIDVMVRNNPNLQGTISLSDESIHNLAQHIQDLGFSGVIALSNGERQRFTGSPEISNPSSDVFAIHSVGKIFTGLLTIVLLQDGTISEEILNKVPVELDKSVYEVLPPNVREQLDKTSLRKLMVHEAGFADYLDNYRHAIREALHSKPQKQPPRIEKIEDLLQFADDYIVPLKDGKKESYSNLGILLLGLSLQHHYNKKNPGPPKTFDEILFEKILKPANMNVYVKAPSGKNVHAGNIEEAQIIASPGGGHWTTPEDMIRLGVWLQKKWKETDKGSGDKTFQEFVKEYGREFYNESEQAISHGGQVPNGSAHFYTSLREDNPSTIVVMSDQGSGKLKMLSVISNHICERTAMEKKGMSDLSEDREFNFQFKLEAAKSKSGDKTTPDKKSDRDFHI